MILKSLRNKMANLFRKIRANVSIKQTSMVSATKYVPSKAELYSVGWSGILSPGTKGDDKGCCIIFRSKVKSLVCKSQGCLTCWLTGTHKINNFLVIHYITDPIRDKAKEGIFSVFYLEK